MGKAHEDYLKLAPPLSYGEWVAAGCPTDPVTVQAEADRRRSSVLESLDKLPRLQDEFGRHLDERPPTTGGSERRCEACEATLTTELYGGAWVLPQHGHPLRERICPGSYTPGAAP